jgi:hypothetical protein
MDPRRISLEDCNIITTCLHSCEMLRQLYQEGELVSILHSQLLLTSYSQSTNSTGQRSSDGRPPIPTRPGNNNDSDEDDNKLDERDLGDEAPQVVVLNESRDLTAAEADLAKQSEWRGRVLYTLDTAIRRRIYADASFV